jgi:regulator of sigma E protease
VYLYSDVSLLLELGNGEPIDVTVLRNGEKITLQNVPVQTYTGTAGESYQGYGLYIAQDRIEPATPGTVLKNAWLNTLDFARIVRLSLQMLFTGEAGMDDVSGPVGIVSTVTQMGQESESVREAVDNILYFAALIAVNLAVMNLLPIPALDGGHIFFLVLDAVSLKLFRKKIPDRYETALSGACFALLMVFMLAVTFHDVFKLFQ